MFLRKALVALGPVVLCLLSCVLFRWLDTLFASSDYFGFLLKGLLLGAAIGLVLPAAGIQTRHTGLTGYLYVASGILFAVLAYQCLETARVLSWPLMRAIVSTSGASVLAEAAMLAFTLLTAVLQPKRHA